MNKIRKLFGFILMLLLAIWIELPFVWFLFWPRYPMSKDQFEAGCIIGLVAFVLGFAIYLKEVL